LSLSSFTDIQDWLRRVLNDPLARKLIENSTLTMRQIQTLLIDISADFQTGKRLTFEEKADLRLDGKKTSRGAFNRTLRQARKNVIRSSFTLILLGYLNVLGSPRLEPYMEVANRLESYARAYEGAWESTSSGAKDEVALRIVSFLEKELLESLDRLSKTSSLSSRV